MRAFYTLTIGLVGTAAALSLLGCKKGERELPTDTEYASPSSPPPVQMVNTMPGCEDLPLCERECELGNATGCEAAGRMYEYHLEPKDMAKAAGLYERACTLGWQGGCANWAIMLENGRGVPQDLAHAKKLYEGACTAGAGLACDRLRAIARDGG